MKLSNLIISYNKLKDYSEKHDAKFNYVISRIKKILKDEVEIYEESIKPSNKFQEYDRKRMNILLKYCERDINGDVLFEDDNKQIIKLKQDTKDECLKKLEELHEEYKETIEERNNQLTTQSELLEKDIDLGDKLPKIKLNEIPNINTWLMDLLVELDIIEN